MRLGTVLSVGAIALAFAGLVAGAQSPGRDGRGPGQRPPGGPAESSPPAMEPQQLIRQFDRDGDGRISREEAPERMKQRWEQIDTDGDGYITLEEFKARDARVGRTGKPPERSPPAATAGPRPAAGGTRDTTPRHEPKGQFTVILMGTGSPRYDPDRSGPSALIQYQGRYLLVDMGNGTQARLSQAGIAPRQIAALMLTHHHLDHNEEFSPLYIHAHLTGGKPDIVGPPGTSKLVDFTRDFYAEDIAYRLRRVGRTAEDFGRGPVREIQGGEAFSLAGIQITTARVNHSIHTVAYRFEADGQSIVISGDLTYSETLVRLARNADLLVIDSGGAIVRKRGDESDGGAGGNVAQAAGGGGDALKAHSTAEEVGTMAQDAGAKRLVLTHIAPGDVDEAATVRGLSTIYKGEVIVGRDLLELSPSAAAPARTGPAPGRSAASARVYVSAAARGNRDGKTWATALATVQEGIEAAARQGGGEVWVAQGTYRPTVGTDRNASIQLRPGVAIYGGFAGTETQRDARDWQRNATVLSGDIGHEGVNTDNSYHVVTGASEAVLDGFTISGGYALDAGPAGARGPRREGPPGPSGKPGPPGQPPIHITPETVLAGANAGSGAGMLNYQCAPTVRNCTFQDNAAGKGGAMYNMVSRDFPGPRGAATPAPQVSNCRFLHNHARGRGGAVANDLGTSPTLRDCTFIGNSCDGKGGAIYNDFGCSPVLVNCLLAENRAVSAGAIGNDGGSSPLLVHCTFTRNAAEEEGAALYQGTGPANNPVVVGCILWGDRCDNGPAEIYNWHDNDPRVSASCVQNGYPGEGNSAQDPQFADAAHGDYRLRVGSPCRDIGHTAATDEKSLAQYFAQRPPGPGRKPDSAAKPRRPVTQGPVTRIYVDAGNTRGPRDGAAWRTAFSSLQEALAAASGHRAEVWVAAGTYKPTGGTDRAAAFCLQEGIELYGGFGGRETERSQRDWTAHPTILSGDIGRAGDVSDNAYHVVIGADGAALDGFVIRDGNADGRTYDGKGGGMINYQRGVQMGPMGPPTGFSPVVRNCLFTHNRAREGGAVYNYDRGAPQFADCRFVENSADYGGALVDRVGVTSVLTGCAFEGNAARWRGGAMFLDYGARPRLTDCRFTANSSERHGGAVATVSRASQLENTIAVLTNCTLADNRANGRGGAIFNCDSSVLGLEGCTLSGNHAGTGGGGLACEYRVRAVLVNCQFHGNHAAQGEADIATDGSSTISRDRSDWPDQTTR